MRVRERKLVGMGVSPDMHQSIHSYMSMYHKTLFTAASLPQYASHVEHICTLSKVMDGPKDVLNLIYAIN